LFRAAALIILRFLHGLLLFSVRLLSGASFTRLLSAGRRRCTTSSRRVIFGGVSLFGIPFFVIIGAFDLFGMFGFVPLIAAVKGRFDVFIR
jgi:hypothetical protein